MALGAVIAVLVCGQVSQRQVRPVLAQVDARPMMILGDPVQAGPISLVPIESSKTLGVEKYLTLGEASKMGVIEIVEVPGRDDFTHLEVRNKASLPILLFSGELLLGGKQDRIVAEDSIIPPHERKEIPVYCVEHNRWEGQPRFHYGATVVPENVRAMAQVAKSQTRVWNNVAQSNATVAAAPMTGTLRGTLDSPKVQAEAGKLFEQLKAKFPVTPRTVGVIAWVNGKIESADIFGNAAMFKASKDELFRSYAVDAQISGRKSNAPVDKAQCLKFLTHILIARRTNEAAGRFEVSDGLVNGVEFGSGGFGGGLAAPKPTGAPGAAGRASFGHGTYRPNNNSGGQ